MTENYYHATRRVDVAGARLDGELNEDVVILGAGLAGLSAALELAQRGFRPVVLEARKIGWGASGRNGGQVLPGFAASMHKLSHLLGADDARKLWDMSVEGVNLLHERIRAHDIPCDPRSGYLHAAIKPRHVRDLRAEQAELARLGAPVGRLLQGAELRARLDSPRYIAALEDRLAGHVHPYNYTLGLAKAAIAAGARIFEDAPVSHVAHGDPVVLRVGPHIVRAKHLILAGGAYLGKVEPKLAGYVMPVTTYVMATEPRADVPGLIPGDEAVCDLNFVLDYFRRSPDDRMLFGGRVSYSTLPPPNLAAAMQRRMLAVFPQLRAAKVDFVWGGNVDITVNRAPHFGRLAPNMLFLQGFSGHGVALTGLAGRLAAEVVAGQAERFDIFARIKHAPFPGGRAMRMPALVLATAWFRLRDLL